MCASRFGLWRRAYDRLHERFRLLGALMINVFQPALGQDELASVEKVFASNWIGKGEVVRDFERAFAENLRADPAHFTTTNCCTEGIFLAAELFDFGDGDEVIGRAL